MKSAHRWAKFWFRNYEGNVCLRACSMAAQGLWMRMLCYMHEAERFGYLQYDATQLSRLTGETVESVQALIAELEKNEVFSRSGDGTIFCRRMVRATAVSKVRAAAGGAGGKAKAAKQRAAAADPAPPQPEMPHENGSKNVANDMANGLAKPLSEDKRIESNIPSPTETGREPPSASPRERLWGEGPAIVAALTGQSAPQARKILGKLLGAVRDDCQQAMEILIDARAKAPLMEPVAWLLGAAKARMEPATSQEPPSIRTAAIASLLGVDVARKTHDAVFQTIDSQILKDA